jgi:hypothetical protein
MALKRGKIRNGEVLCLCAEFVLSRAVAVGFAQVAFDAGPLQEDYVQYLDVGSLQHRLLPSLYYWYSQPPLFNAFLGVVLHVFPHSAVAAFRRPSCSAVWCSPSRSTFSSARLALTVGWRASRRFSSS